MSGHGIVVLTTSESRLSIPAVETARTAKYQVAGARSSTTADVTASPRTSRRPFN